ncbi:MAG: CDP-glycerol glycerophosphotransferase family protein, partial [Bacilli bacterium]|nr:CDP-glycerol glycerophosphotransferase family protein [Bacilli bacterium]
MTAFLYIFKYHLKFIYFFLKIFTKPKKQIFFLSRQSNTPSLNYKLLISYIEKQDPSVSIKISCKKVSTGLNKVLHSSNKSIKVIPTILSELRECLKYYFLLYKQMYYIATSKVIITDGYNILISTLKHKKDTKIIQMWHALAAIKQFGCESIGKKDGMAPNTAKILEVHNHYDYILAGSDAMIEPFSAAFNTEISKILPIGTPYIDYLLTKKVDKKNIYKNYPELKKKPVILYSPTFRRNGHDAINEVISSI